MTNRGQALLLLAAQLFIIASLNMTDPYWPLILQHFHHFAQSKQLQCWTAAIYMAPFFVTIFTLPLWSHLGERIGHKKMILRASFALIITQLLIGFCSDPLLILGIRLIQGLFAGFTAAAQAWLIIFSKENNHSQVVGQMQAATAIGTIIGPIFGGLVAHYLGYRSLFFVSASICAFVIVTLFHYLKETPIKFSNRRFFQNGNFEKLTKDTLFFLALICGTQAARWMSTPFFALYATERFQGGTLLVGLLYACTALTICVSAPFWGALTDKTLAHDPLRVKWFFLINIFLAALSQYFFAITTHSGLAIFAALLLGFSLGALSTLSFSMLMRCIEGPHKGSLIGFGNSASKLGNLVGVGLGALIQAESNFTSSFIAIAIFYLLLGLVFFVSGSRIVVLKIANRQE